MRFSTVFFISLLTLVVTSCVNDCHLVDCEPVVFFNVEVLDEATNLTLLSDTSSVYKVDDMTVTSNVDGEIIMGTVGIVGPTQGNSFNLGIIVNVDPSVMFLKLSEVDTDTLRFVNQLVERDCCDSYMLDSVSVNGGAMVVLDDVVTILK